MIGMAYLQSIPPRWTARILLAVILVPAPMFAQAHFTLDSARTQLSFRANSTMGGFQGVAQQRSGQLEIANLQTLAGARGEVRIGVASIKTGIGMRDGHLRSDMKADQFPWFVVQVDSVRADSLANPRNVRLFSRITFRGVTRARVLAAELRASGDTLAVNGRFPMTFSEFGFTPPSRMLGMAKVKDAWEISFDVRFVRAQ